MRSLLLQIILLGMLAVAISSQSTNQAEAARQERDRKQREQNRDDRITKMRELTEPRDKPRRAWVDQHAIEALKRSQMDEALKEAREIDPEILGRYQSFLDQKGTGIFTLLPNADCVTSSTIDVSGECSGFVPESSEYSFRSKRYEGRTFFDIALNRNRLSSRGFFSLGILLSMGDISMDGVTLETQAIKVLSDFEPGQDLAAAQETARALMTGFSKSGLRFSNSIDVADNTTYAIKLVAFGLKNLVPSPDWQKYPVQRTFASAEFIRRDEMLIAFKIVNKNADGKVTIVWKELSRNDAPKLKFGRQQEWRDIWPS